MPLVIQSRRPKSSDWLVIDRLTTANAHIHAPGGDKKLREAAEEKLAEWNYHSMDLNGYFQGWSFRIKEIRK